MAARWIETGMSVLFPPPEITGQLAAPGDGWTSSHCYYLYSLSRHPGSLSTYRFQTDELHLQGGKGRASLQQTAGGAPDLLHPPFCQLVEGLWSGRSQW